MRRKKNKLPKLHIKKGDTVKVISGDHDLKGKVGRVLVVNPAKQTAIVEDVNLVTRHIKQSQEHPNGTLLTKEAPVHVSKLQLIDPSSGKPTRIGRRKTENGWVRYAKVSGKDIDKS